MDNMMRFKAQVMPGGTTLNPALSVCAPCPIPPAHTKYGIDDHHAGLSFKIQRDLYALRSIPSHHHSHEWREQVKEEKKHLNDHKRIHMGQAIVTYFKKLHKIA